MFSLFLSSIIRMQQYNAPTYLLLVHWTEMFNFIYENYIPMSDSTLQLLQSLNPVNAVDVEKINSYISTSDETKITKIFFSYSSFYIE
jgi:hypothetical protein